MAKRAAGSAGVFRPIVAWLRKGTRRDKGKNQAPPPPNPSPGAGQSRYPKQKPMLDKYKNETDPNNSIFPGQSVRRLTPEELEAHRVYLDHKGIMRNATDGERFDTSGATTVHNEGNAIFVMDGNGNIFASNYQASGQFHHSTLGNGNPVAAAGELSVTNGKVNFANSNSGHYQPQIDQMSNLNQEFKRHGINPPIFDNTGTIQLNDKKHGLM
jgi:hypothetical protein